MGAIGRAVADCAAAFGAEVCYCSISGAVRREKYENVDLSTLLTECDIISIHAPLNEKTMHLIGEKELKMMKRTAYIVNVGRGAVIDEKALAEAIDNGIIGGAALDVFTTEPPEATSPIMNVKNKERIVYTPHTAWSSVEARTRCISMTADNIDAFVKGESRNDVWS
jgi:glycerate dehydrogenase